MLLSESVLQVGEEGGEFEVGARHEALRVRLVVEHRQPKLDLFTQLHWRQLHLDEYKQINFDINI